MLKIGPVLLSIIMFLGVSSSCNLREGKSPSLTYNNQAVQLILHPYPYIYSPNHPFYSMGEGILFELQIINNNEIPIEFHEFDFSDIKLAFSSPNAIRLIGPDGDDLLLPYDVRDTTYDYGEPLQVDPKGEKWRILPITSNIHLQKSGEYTLWVELADNFGIVHMSNSITFYVQEIEPSISPELVTLTLTIPSENKSAFFTERVVEVTFTNNSDVPLTFLIPQVGSVSGWINPGYQLSVVDSSGRFLVMVPTEFVPDKPVYDESTRFTVAPGESYRQQVGVPNYLGVQPSETYEVWLTYLVREQFTRWGVVTDELMDWDETVFIGRIESNRLRVTLNE
jgi:hypothetical protein